MAKDKKRFLKNEYVPQDGKVCAEDLIIRCMDGSDYERGSLETAQATADNVVFAFARLIQELSDDKILTDKQVEYIARRY